MFCINKYCIVGYIACVAYLIHHYIPVCMMHGKSWHSKTGDSLKKSFCSDLQNEPNCFNIYNTRIINITFKNIGKGLFFIYLIFFKLTDSTWQECTRDMCIKVHYKNAKIVTHWVLFAKWDYSKLFTHKRCISVSRVFLSLFALWTGN